MRKTFFAATAFSLLTFALLAAPIFAQKKKVAKKTVKPIIFAVLNDGKTLEPIAVIDKGKLTQASDGGDETAKLNAFVKTYYQPKATYRLVFGGADEGTVTIKKSTAESDCGRNMADATTVAKTAKLGGMVMALATSAPVDKTAKVIRRKPTPAERAEIETLVRAEFAAQKISSSALKNLRYHNLTALDVDRDGTAELVGSYWVENAPKERALLFFIADKTGAKYSFGFSEFQAFKESEMMEGSSIEALENGVYNELLLDTLEYTGDRVGEIFTYKQGLEGAGFNAYSREKGKWVRVFEGSNYHCGF